VIPRLPRPVCLYKYGGNNRPDMSKQPDSLDYTTCFAAVTLAKPFSLRIQSAHGMKVPAEPRPCFSASADKRLCFQ
jgi:hypothetical protein